MKARLVRPWILFPYKSRKSWVALTLKATTLKLQEVANFARFFRGKLFILFMLVCNKN